MWQARAIRQQPALLHIYEMLLRDEEPMYVETEYERSLSTANVLFLRLCRTLLMRTGASKRTETQPSPKVPS